MNNKCKAWSEKIVIPTYIVGEEEAIPHFMDKRVYQGSSGKVYPYPIIDKISEVKENKTYEGLFIENDYVKILILPELGGRIHKAWDKIGNQDFVYCNQTIKPALVGLLGPWISGGIEFNWPQHHRPTTYKETDWDIENTAEKSTVYISEWEKKSGQRLLMEFVLYPDSAYIEVNVRVFNTSSLPQTFLWWANPAFKAGNGHRSIFPPDVTAVCDHGKRDVSRFPIATGTYYKQDYSEGIDISRYKNIPVPTSYMAWKSNYDFVGVYDYDSNIGLMHVADRHVVPGKKQWTWGNADFGKAWDYNLTEEDGPYIELMTGAFTDNQPDFTWIKPYEEKSFTQYFMPFRDLDNVQNATKDLLLKCDIPDTNNSIDLGLFAITKFTGFIHVKHIDKVVLQKDIELNVGQSWMESLEIKIGNRKQLAIEVFDNNNNKVLSYYPKSSTMEEVPAPATAPAEPEDVRHIDELYYIGVHIEQYRYATSTPEKYWNEALQRDPLDSRCNMAMGRLMLRYSNFSQAEIYLQNALKRITMKNANPESGEIHYLLGLCYEYQNHYDKAFPHYYKSIWDGSYKDKGFYSLACLSTRKGEYEKAREFLTQSLAHNLLNQKAKHLDIYLDRMLGQIQVSSINNYLDSDPLAFSILYEKYLLNKDNENLLLLKNKLRDNVENYIELALLYSKYSNYQEAFNVLDLIAPKSDPMYWAYKLYYANLVENQQAIQESKEALTVIKKTTVFPNRLDDIAILEYATQQQIPIANYLLACLYYDKKQYELAKENWLQSIKIQENAVVFRCLAIYYYNQEQNVELAQVYLDKAITLDPTEARFIFERDQLAKKAQESPKQRIERLSKYPDIVSQRDDLFIEWISLLNLNGEFEKALQNLESRQFHPWEGGEGKVTTQWILSHLYLGIKKLSSSKTDAYAHFSAALSYPRNLGEGKLPQSTDNDIMFWLSKSQKNQERKDHLNKASSGTEEVQSMMYYNDFPADYIFWQGMALHEMGNMSLSKKKFYTLIDFAESHYNEIPTIDFLSISLPDFLVFDDDLGSKNKAHCNFLLAMGYIGLQQSDKALHYLNSTLDIDPNHIKAHFIKWCFTNNLLS